MSRPRSLSVGVVHTAGSPCRCHASLLPALRRLGHRAFAVDADALPAGLDRLARADAVFDQTDTFRGEAYLRSFVRAELERAGVRVLGSSSAAAADADDKGLARERLARGGIPVARGVVVRLARDRLPRGLAAPLVVKGAFEHGSRGLTLAPTRGEAERAARAWARRGRPAVVEELVPGMEVTVSLVGRPLRALPPVAVRLPSTRGRASLLTFARKWTGFSGAGAPAGRLGPAYLAPAARRRLEALARRAARLLCLSGYARFDVRLRPDGSPVFLEANARPSLERGGDTAVAAALGGLAYDDLVRLLLGTGVGGGRA